MEIRETAIANLEIPVVDGRGAEWKRAVRHLMELGKNFILLLCKKSAEVKSLRGLLWYEPSTVEKWETYSLADLLSREDKSRLTETLAAGDCAFFIELIHKPDLRPPQTKRFLVYCEIMGIIAEADSLTEAKEACDHHAAVTPRIQRKHSLVSIYKWRNQQWEALKIPC